MNNKENLLNAAIDLFSKKGYSGVSVRDICGKLALKESALYYHFKNKEDILNTIYEKIDELIQNMQSSFNTAFVKTTEISNTEMCMVAKSFLHGYYCDEYVSKTLSMLSIERRSSQIAERMYQKLTYDMPLNHCTKVFALMQEKGIILNVPPEYLAKEYLCAILFAYDRFAAGSNDREAGIIKACEEVDQQISIFYERIKR